MATFDSLSSNGDLSNANAITGSISTSVPNEVIVIGVNSNSQVTSITDTAGLNWQLRAFVNTGTVGTDPRIEEWWAPAPTILTGDSFTIFLAATTHVEYVQGAVQGAANINSPWDPNASLPGTFTSINSFSGACAPISTNNAASMPVLVYGAGGFGIPSTAAGFTKVGYDRGTYGNITIDYQSRNSQANNLQVAVNTNASGHIGVISDAILAPGPKFAGARTVGF